LLIVLAASFASAQPPGRQSTSTAARPSKEYTIEQFMDTIPAFHSLRATRPRVIAMERPRTRYVIMQ
jgi:hypothetical protein